MNALNIPEAFTRSPDIPDTLVYSYSSDAEITLKSRITITSHLFSFLLEGEKEVHFNEESFRCGPDEAVLFTSGNCLMTEKSSPTKHYRSLLFFFSDARLAEVRSKYPDLFAINGGRRTSFVLRQDEFIRAFVASLQQIESRGAGLAEPLLKLKLEELILYLVHTYPGTFPAFVSTLGVESPEGRFKNVVENNTYSNLTLDELAFLCHVSLSTFKRRFENLYGMPPIRWFQEKRMQQAALLLRYRQRKASDIYMELGYENLSSFIQAFKKEFGVTPKTYQGDRRQMAK